MADTVIVNVNQGTLRGKIVTAYNGVTYYSFQGIPYAKPPVGPLRFKVPQPPEPWDGIRDALSVGNCAPQMNFLSPDEFIGDEDCLFLNVYTTQFPAQSDDKKMAVMVWIHGGGFNMGSGYTDLHGPDHLIAGDVVIVTFNYRLGALGFLYIEDAEMSGNTGMKDQVMALKWVQQNIAKFGGDPNNVTIFGGSAGGASVHYQVLSPMSEGLFHKAIAQSGCALNPWAQIRNPRERAFKIGATLGCQTTDSKKLLEFLQTVSPQDLVEAVEKMRTPEEQMSLDFYFAPCVENVVQDGDEKFLPEDPYSLMSTGKFNKVPFIIGFCSHEGKMMLRGLDGKPLKTEKLNEDSVIPYTIKLKKNTPLFKQLGSKIRKFYFGENPVCKETLPQLIDVYGDALFIHGVRKCAELQVPHQDVPLYLYHFSFDEDLETFRKIFGGVRITGATHGGEMPYLFKGMFTMEERLIPNTDHTKMINIIVKLWTDFAKTGNPTPNGEKDDGINWKPLSKSGEQTFLDITLVPSMKEDKERYEFWDIVYKQL